MKICAWSLLAAAGLACSANGQVIISEIADGPQSGGNPKMVEITNVGLTDVLLDAGDRLVSVNNGTTTVSLVYDFGASPLGVPNAVTIPAGGSITIVSTANGGAAQYLNAFGAANPPIFTAAFMGNGNDEYRLEIDAVIVDRYGNAPDVSGTSDFADPWAYADSYARRIPSVCAPNATFTIGEWIVGTNDRLELPNPNGPAANYTAIWINNSGFNLSPNAHQFTCGGRSNDCNGNGLEDFAETGATPAIDLDRNRIPDSCDVGAGAFDCNFDNVPDAIQIFNGTFLDANLNGIPDGCESVVFDCNGNFIEDSADISSGTSTDCNGNAVPDECDFSNGTLTDANGNSVADACEGAAVVEASVNATVTATGVRADPNGSSFFNIQGSEQVNLPPTPAGQFRSYGGLRFSIASFASVFDATFGVGGWDVDRVYLNITQSNAGFTANGVVELFHSNNDALDFTPGNATTIFDNFMSDLTDRVSAASWTFTQIANGAVENYLIFNSAATNSAGGAAIAAEIDGGSGELTAAIKDITTTVAATYAGRTNNTYRGPTFVVFAKPAAGGGCDSDVTPCRADQDGDEDIDSDDINIFFSNFESGDSCGDQDGDDDVDSDDINIFFGRFEAGGC